MAIRQLNKEVLGWVEIDVEIAEFKDAGLNAREEETHEEIEGLLQSKKYFKPTSWIAKHKTEMLITLIALGTILGFISTLVGVIGGLSIASGHSGLFSNLAPLNTAFTSIWKGLPYLLAAFGAPGVLLLLGGMLIGAFYGVRLLADRKSNRATSEIKEESRDSSAKKPEDSFKTRFLIIDKIRRKEISKIKDEKKILHKHKINSVFNFLNEKESMYAYQMERQHAVFVFIDKDTNPDKQYCVVDVRDNSVVSHSYASYEDILNSYQGKNIITDIKKFRNLVRGKNNIVNTIVKQGNESLYAAKMAEKKVVFAYKDSSEQFKLVYSFDKKIWYDDFDNFDDLKKDVKVGEEIITDIKEFNSLIENI